MRKDDSTGSDTWPEIKGDTMTKQDEKPEGKKTARDFTTNRDEIVRVSDWREDGWWVIVLSIGGKNFCTYAGIPIDHPLANHDYDNLPIDCHGGLTFAGAGDGEYRPEGYYWYGWDYGHSGDYIWWGNEEREPMLNEKDWTLDEVKKDAWSGIYDLKKLKALAESIYTKAKGW